MDNEHLESLLVATSHQIMNITVSIDSIRKVLVSLKSHDLSHFNSKEIDLHIEMLKHRKEELKSFQEAFDYYMEFTCPKEQ